LAVHNGTHGAGTAKTLSATRRRAGTIYSKRSIAGICSKHVGARSGRNYGQRVMENKQVYRALVENNPKLFVEADLRRGG